MIVLSSVIQLYLLILFARILFSWFPAPREGVLATIDNVAHVLTEPVLAPIRSVLPPVRVGATALDLAPMIVFLVLVLLAGFLRR